MSDADNSMLHGTPVAQAVVQQKRKLSVIWIVPLVALIIGGWLVYKALSEKGPTITISFKTAEGLEAGKTKIKYKDVDIGMVTAIRLSDDLTHVILTAELVSGAEHYLTDQTRFWVVRARLTASEVSGIGTLFGGVYISIDPGKEGAPQRDFTGLESPPVVTADLPGKHFILKAEQLGSIDTGSPVYYRQIRVGQVSEYGLDEDGRHVTLKIFINEPHHKLVTHKSRFWNASGMDLRLDAGGITIDTQSLVSMMIGGIAFSTPLGLNNAEPASENDVFMLYDNQETARENIYQIKHHWVLNFKGSIRGLSPGAPVEFRGIPVGKVLDVASQFDMDAIHGEIVIPVLIETEPERYLNLEGMETEEDLREFVDSLVEKGLRARLCTGNLLTGQLYVEMDFHEDAIPQKIDWSGTYPVLPTVSQPIEELTARLTAMLRRIEEIPVEQISRETRDALRNLKETAALAGEALTHFNAAIAPEAMAALAQTNQTLTTMESMISVDSTLRRETAKTLEELAGAARSMRMLMDYLERHPDALIYGKGVDH
jgi:paraquat-inducible protein B